MTTKPNPRFQLDSGLLKSLTSAVLRRVNIQTISAKSAHADSATIEKIDFANAGIDKVNIENLSTRIKCGSVILRDVRVILELHYTVDWSYDFKWLGTDSGTKILGSKAKPIPLHDINIPMLQDIVLTVPEAEVKDIEADIQSVSDFSLGSIDLDHISINNTNLPSDGFSLSGMDFESLRVEDFGVPASDSDHITVGQFSPVNPMGLPSISIKGINIPSVDIEDVTSDGAVSIMDIQPGEFEAPVFKIGDLFKAYFIVTPFLHFQIGELVLSELAASASIDCVQINGATASVAATNISLDKLVLGDLAVNQINI